ncbi:MAG: hypothetical protein JSS51_12790 [Planctomycetes bacterium]|nr:hypothetical protein [Planctomycetota bacterium]
MSDKPIDDILSQRDTDALHARLDDISTVIVLDSSPEDLDGACAELSQIFCRLVRSDWHSAATVLAVTHVGLWASLPKHKQRDIVLDTLCASLPNIQNLLTETIVDYSFIHMRSCPEIVIQLLRLCRESPSWADSCFHAIQQSSGSLARKWLEDNWTEPTVDELLRVITSRDPWNRDSASP